MEEWKVNSLPEATGNYLVTIRLYDKRDVHAEPYYFVAIAHYNGCGNWTEHNTKYERIIAWMNLPDVYEDYER